MSNLSLGELAVPLLLVSGVVVVAMATLLLHLLFPPSRHLARRSGLQIRRLRCPLCGDALDRNDLGGVSVQAACRGCGGAWLSRDELEQLRS